jgi:hypothetical protein
VTESSTSSRSAARAILTGGLIGGAIDITYAISFAAYRGMAPSRLLQTVASGALGASALDGGTGTAALGLVLHFCIALIWASIFYLASRRLKFLTAHPVVSGVLFGIVIYFGMNLVVLPLSAFPRKVTFTLLATSTGLIIHMFGIGLPIALSVRRFSPPLPS